MPSTVRATDIADYLQHQHHAAPAAAKQAGRDIAAAWNDYEFWLEPTLAPLRQAAAASPEWTTPPREVVTALAIRFGRHIHDSPTYTPAVATEPNGRPRIRLSHCTRARSSRP
ncbi:hypothetical protein [Amycolatopsis australiensis]|uniref:Uncharacterized protein n=1 Tax=Amycolatopsis australiensis TaxID=546364 RepID=A0A1K1LLB7_9PSEU|nr:hypothetical protein [Amycolatopsis australiensis]SFW11672.1 hypothetical protein SAMN04489730_0046 [Amycolatopsis australiensis]